MMSPYCLSAAEAGSAPSFLLDEAGSGEEEDGEEEEEEDLWCPLRKGEEEEGGLAEDTSRGDPSWSEKI